MCWRDVYSGSSSRCQRSANEEFYILGFEEKNEFKGRDFGPVFPYLLVEDMQHSKIVCSKSVRFKTTNTSSLAGCQADDHPTLDCNLTG